MLTRLAPLTVSEWNQGLDHQRSDRDPAVVSHELLPKDQGHLRRRALGLCSRVHQQVRQHSIVAGVRSLAHSLTHTHACVYVYRFYHSQYDDASNVNMSAICAASNTLARSLYLLALDDQSAVTASQINEIAVDCDTVAQFFHCLVVDTNCTLFHKFSGSSSSKVDLPPPSRYTSVYSRHRVALLSKFIYDWISYQTSPFRSIKKCDDHSQCKDKRAPACLAGVCVAPGYSFFHDAYSPAFELIGGEWRIVDKTESLWTES